MAVARTILQRLLGMVCMLWLPVACGRAPATQNTATATVDALASRTVAVPNPFATTPDPPTIAGAGSTPQRPSALPVDGSSWMLAMFETDDTTRPVVGDAPITVEFADGTVRGSTGCNDYGGSYTLEGSTITFGELAVTAAACEAAIMAQEGMFLAALRTATSLIIDGALLRLAYADGTLVFEPLGTQGTDAVFQQTLPEALAQQAQLIILGETVGPQTSARVPPGSPLAPPEPPGEPAHAEPPSIYTETQVRVERALKGAAPGDSIRVRTLGGSVDGQAMAMTHTPQLHVDQRVVLFLKQIEPGYFVVLGEDGVYVIADDIAAGPRHQFPLSELLKRIKASSAN